MSVKNRERGRTIERFPLGSMFPEGDFDVLRSSTLGTFEKVMDEVFGNKQRIMSLAKNEIEYPKVNVGLDKDSEYLAIKFFVPGLKKENIVIEYDRTDKTLHVSQLKEDEDDEDKKEYDWIYRENRVKSFSRKINLANHPIEISKKRQINTSLTDGVLTVEVPLEVDSIKQENRKLLLEVD